MQNAGHLYKRLNNLFIFCTPIQHNNVIFHTCHKELILHSKTSNVKIVFYQNLISVLCLPQELFLLLYINIIILYKSSSDWFRESREALGNHDLLIFLGGGGYIFIFASPSCNKRIL